MIPNFSLSDVAVYGTQYYDVVKDLLENLMIDDVSEHSDRIRKFAEKYTVLPKLWMYWYELDEYSSKQSMHFKIVEHDEGVEEHLSYYNRKPHLYMNYNEEKLQRELCGAFFVKDAQHFKKLLNLPHSGMETLFTNFDRHSTSSLGSTKKYKAAMKLKETLKVIERNEELWFKYIKETEDIEFIINSCEYRLSKNPENKEFWFCYLQYLKECGNAEMLLKTYSRYCRLFLHEKNMREKYYKEICTASNLKHRLKFWKDYVMLMKIFTNAETCDKIMNKVLTEHYEMPADWSFPWSTYERNLNIFEEIITEKEEANMDESGSDETVDTQESEKNIEIPTTLSPSYLQNFSFHQPFIDYILSTLPFHLLFQLQMSCKYFFFKLDTVYCQRLCLKSPSRFDYFQNSLNISYNNLHLANLKKFNLINSLETTATQSSGRPMFENEVRTLSTIIQSVKACNLRYLVVFDQIITFEDFVKVTESQTLRFVELFNFYVKHEDGMGDEYLKIEQILGNLPNVVHFKFRSCPNSVTPETASKLAVLKRNQKFKTFYLDGIPPASNIDDFCIFIQENAAPSAMFTFESSALNFLSAFKARAQELILRYKKLSNVTLKFGV